MLRMAIHRHGAAPAARAERVASGLAFAGSLVALLAVPDPQRLFMRAQPGELTALQALSPLLLETAPWLLLALLIGELVARRRRRDQEGDGSAPTAMWLPMVSLSLPLLGVFFTLVRALLEPFCGAARLHDVGQERGTGRGALAVLARAAPRAKFVLPSHVVGVVLAIAIEAIVPGHGLDVGLIAVPFVVVLAVVLRIGAAGITVVAALLAHKGGTSLASALSAPRTRRSASSTRSRAGMRLQRTLIFRNIFLDLRQSPLRRIDTPSGNASPTGVHRAGVQVRGTRQGVESSDAGPPDGSHASLASSFRPPC
jgi:hypothetical protein